jgi:drug/metabolite transporter (DMT)-like permease
MTSLGLAVLASFAYGVAMVLQGVGVQRSEGRSRCLGRLPPSMRHPAFLGGLLLDLVAWILSRIALHGLAVFAVQSILAGSLAVTVIGAEVFLKAPVQRRDHIAIAVVLGGLVLVGSSAGPQTIDTIPRFYDFFVVLGAPMIAAVGAMSLRLSHPAIGGVLGGLALGGSSLAARPIHIDSFVAIVSDPLSWAVIAYSVTGVVLVTRALEYGRVGPVSATMWTAEIVPATVVGLVVLGDHARAGYGPVAFAGVGLTVAATVALALSPAIEVEPTV